MFANKAYANTPELSFAGDFNYSYSTVTTIGFLTLSGNLIGSEGLSVAPVLLNSQFTLTSKFQSALYDSASTEGIFGSSITQISPWDFNIVGGDNAKLLQGKINSLSITGINGYSFGFLSADLDALTGDLISSFNASSSSLLGLMFNLSTPLSQGVFETSFKGNVNGSLTAKTTKVFESSSALVMLVGLLALFSRKLKT